jgi:uncharacterized protein DUF1206
MSTARLPVASRPLREALRQAARLGHVAMGIVYVVVGFTALIAAFDRRLQPTGAEGALYALRASALGKAAVAGIAVGLVADSVWQGVRAVFDSDRVGNGVTGVAQRVAAAVTGLLHLGLAIAAMRLLVATSPPTLDATANSWLVRILALGPGPWLVGFAGAVTLGVAASVLYIAVTPEMLTRLNLEAMPRTLRVATALLARVGYLARGAVYAIIGGLLLLSALHHHAAEPGTMGGALRTVRYERHGTSFLALLGVGFIANGTVELVRARHRTIRLR